MAQRSRAAVGLCTAVLALVACGGEEQAASPAPAAPGFAFAESAVVEGAPIDAGYTCDGDDVSPALAWSGVPDGTRELALVVDDLDADGFVHWLVYGLDPTATALPGGVPPDGEVAGPPSLRQGENGFGRIGWGGPCPPGGEAHRYVFHLLALDAATELEGGADRGDLDDAISGHALAEARLEATYRRP